MTQQPCYLARKCNFYAMDIRSRVSNNAMRKPVLPIAAITILLAACQNTGTKTTSLHELTYDYALPRATYDITVSRMLLSCDGSVDKDKDGLAVTYKTEISIDEKFQADPKANGYSLSVGALDTNFQKSNLTIEWYDAGTLKSLNSSVTDETGTVFSNLLKSIASILPLFAIISADVPVLTKADKKRKDELRKKYCHADALAALTEIEQLKEQISATRKNVAALKVPKSPVVHAGAKDVFALGEAKILAAKARIVELQSAMTIKATKKNVAPYYDQISTLSFDVAPKRKHIEKSWLTVAGYTAAKKQARETIHKRTTKDVETTQPYQTHFFFDIRQLSKPKNLPRLEKVEQAIVVRQPPRINLVACDDWCLDKIPATTDELKNSKIHPNAKAQRSPASPGQLGSYGTISLDAKSFEDRSIGLAVSQSGRVSKLEFMNSARAAQATGFLATSAESITGTLTKIRTAEDDADIARFTRERDLLKLEFEIQDFKNKLAGEPEDDE